MSQAHAQGADAFVQAHARLLADRSFQFDFPTYVLPQTPAWLKALERWLRALGPGAGWVFWGLAGLLAAGLLFLVGREVVRAARRGGRLGTKTLQADLYAPTRARVRALLSEADRLAGEGRFGEAVRVLLFRTLDDIEQARPNLIRPAQTSREIVGLQAIPAAARAPLGRIASAVERFVFAGRPLDAEAFAACRADYERFAQAATAANAPVATAAA